MKTLTLITVLAAAATASAQDKQITTADFAGTWNIELMSHQIALVIEPADGNKVTATMMAMGHDTLLKGELVGRTLTLVGAKADGNGNRPADHIPPGQAVATSGSGPKPITVTLQDDGTKIGRAHV